MACLASQFNSICSTTMFHSVRQHTTLQDCN